MSLPQKKFREIVFQLLFSHDFYKIDGDDFIPIMMKLLKTTKKNISSVKDYLDLILQKKDDLDNLIEQKAKEYKLNRISKVELNILRLGFFEINFNKEIPKKVALAEAMRLTKKFGSSSSTKFINAVLDSKE